MEKYKLQQRKENNSSFVIRNSSLIQVSKKTTGLLIILLGLIALVAVIYFMFFYDVVEPVEPVVVEEVVEEVVPEPPVKVLVPLPKVEKPKPKPEVVQIEQKREVTQDEVGQAELQRLASSFAERYGSFSNQSNFQNLKDLAMFMSAPMQERTNDYIEQSLSTRVDASVYYGMSTKALVADLKMMDDENGVGVVLVQTLRQEAKGDISNTTQKNQNIEVKFIKEEGDWKVDKAVWQ